jgi:hypothetical protein
MLTTLWIALMLAAAVTTAVLDARHRRRSRTHWRSYDTGTCSPGRAAC